jgi:aminoglycoside 3-N-acetyltransferase
MSEAEVINKSKIPNTIKSLTQDFQRLGIENGDIVLVHSSLSAIGWVCGEERAVIEALLETIGEEGTLCMPAHSGGNSDPANWANPPVPREWNEIIYDMMPAYQPDITPTRGIGRVAEIFRTYPGVLRSSHPQTSFCARGTYAKEITENHALTPQFGENSPLGRLYQRNAKVLLLGVGYDSCTSFHMGEVLCGSIEITRMGAAMTIHNNREWKWFEDYDYNNEDFIILGNAFESQREVKTSKVGNADCKLFGICEAVEFATVWLQENRGL